MSKSLEDRIAALENENRVLRDAIAKIATKLDSPNSLEGWGPPKYIAGAERSFLELANGIGLRRNRLGQWCD